MVNTLLTRSHLLTAKMAAPAVPLGHPLEVAMVPVAARLTSPPVLRTHDSPLPPSRATGRAVAHPSVTNDHLAALTAHALMPIRLLCLWAVQPCLVRLIATYPVIPFPVPLFLG